MSDNKLQVIINEQGIEKSDVAKLVAAFGGPFDEAGEILATYKEITVTDEHDTATMQLAREKRLLLKKARTTVENKRKDLKADIVKQGKAIDSVARYVKEEIEPAEQYLELQEKFAEIKQAERVAQIKAKRIEQLMQYTNDVSVYNFETMTDEQFASLLAQHKAATEAEAKRVADEAKAREEEAAAEAKRIEDQRIENERLKAEAEANAKAAQAEREAAAAEQAKKDAEAAKVLEAERAKAQAEREKREAIEAEQRAKVEVETKAKAEAEEAERKALLSPDKDKILSFAAGLEVLRTQRLPAVKTKQAQDLINQIDTALKQLINNVTDQAKEL